MSFRDLLLPVVSYPDATPDRAVAAGAALARRFGDGVTALALKVDIKTPRNRLANALIGLEDMVRAEEARSAALAKASIEQFTAAAARAGLRANAIVETVPIYLQGERITEHARTRDLTLLATGPSVLADVGVAEAVLFGSGRPMVIFPEEAEVLAGDRFDEVAIAWDGSRTAARAVADALPVLKAAGSVRILVVTDEKPAAVPGLATDLVRHLQAHAVEAKVTEISAGGEPIGRIIRAFGAEKQVDLLVMGGFGHSRAREFVLGGATAALLDRPPCPVLMSH
ncbi:universal stress protein [Phenylobacterium sp.]|uniref:universal stress protein n=1 Tax=Phenylobacterium sp. TaxID=1871053 RepID=UPI002FDF129A